MIRPTVVAWLMLLLAGSGTLAQQPQPKSEPSPQPTPASQAGAVQQPQPGPGAQPQATPTQQPGATQQPPGPVKAAPAQPRPVTGEGVVPAVWGVLEVPATPGPHPGVILLPGAGGWGSGQRYSQLARLLADSGFAALAIDYFAVTGRDNSRADALLMWPDWEATVRNAVAWLHASPATSGKPIGLVGFSRGGFLAVAVAGGLPDVKAVVDYYGGGGSGSTSVEQQVKNLPPLLILHGDADSIVPVQIAYQLRDAAWAAHRKVEVHIYRGAPHGFNAPGTPYYAEKAARDAARRTIAFLRKRLGP